jgi:hypothetical protein
VSYAGAFFVVKALGSFDRLLKVLNSLCISLELLRTRPRLYAGINSSELSCEEKPTEVLGSFGNSQLTLVFDAQSEGELGLELEISSRDPEFCFPCRSLRESGPSGTGRSFSDPLSS